MHGCTMHVLQLFDTPETLAAAAGEFLAAGGRAGEMLLVVARLPNWPAIEAAIDVRGCSVTQLIAERRLVVLDADALADDVARDGAPRRERFDASIGGIVTQLARATRLRIYSEMVEVLAARGNVEGALRLETFWNELGERSTFDLLCGYSAAHFAADGRDVELRRICAAHGHAAASAADPLGRWLLDPTPREVKAGPARPRPGAPGARGRGIG